MVCTSCLFFGEPKSKPLRAICEFIVSIFASNHFPLFDPDKTCPKCGEKSLVELDTYAGEEALSKRNGEAPDNQSSERDE